MVSTPKMQVHANFFLLARVSKSHPGAFFHRHAAGSGKVANAEVAYGSQASSSAEIHLLLKPSI
jgi:hypothetical protein